MPKRNTSPSAVAAHELRVYHRLQQAAHLIRKEADRAVSGATGLTVAQVSVLTVVHFLADPTQREVATELGINEPAVTDMVKRLVASGHVLRTRTRRDGRAWTLTLTSIGKETLAASRKPFAAVNDLIGTSLSRAQVEDLAKTLDHLIREFSQPVLGTK